MASLRVTQTRTFAEAPPFPITLRRSTQRLTVTPTSVSAVGLLRQQRQPKMTDFVIVRAAVLVVAPRSLAQSILLLAMFGCLTAAAPYQLQDDFSGDNFFGNFTFFTARDPTNVSAWPIVRHSGSEASHQTDLRSPPAFSRDLCSLSTRKRP